MNSVKDEMIEFDFVDILKGNRGYQSPSSYNYV